MQILVTGGNGFVGRVLCRRLLQAGNSVVVLDNCRYEPPRLDTANPRLQFIQGDIHNVVDVRRAIDQARPNAIVHLAALHYIPECENDPTLACSTNIVGTVNLLLHCPPSCHFVFTSSGAVYSPENTPHIEKSSPTVPSDVYGLTKLNGEEYVRYFAAKRRFPATIVRLFNVVGEGETSPHLIPEIMAQLYAGLRSIMVGTLTTRRDYIDVQDVAEGFSRLATRQTLAPIEIVNLGTGIAHSGEEVLDFLRAASGIDFAAVRDNARIRPVDRPFLAASTENLQSLLNWIPASPLAQCLARCWKNPLLPATLSRRYQKSS